MCDLIPEREEEEEGNECARLVKETGEKNEVCMSGSLLVEIEVELQLTKRKEPRAKGWHSFILSR